MADMNVDNINMNLNGRKIGLTDILQTVSAHYNKTNVFGAVNQLGEGKYSSNLNKIIEGLNLNTEDDEARKQARKQAAETKEGKAILQQEADRRNRLNWMGNIYDTVESGIEMILAYREKEYKIIYAGIEMLNATLSQQLQIAGKNVSDGLGLISKVYSGDVKALGSTALKNEMDMMKQLMKFENTFALSKINLDNKTYEANYKWFTNTGKEIINMGESVAKMIGNGKNPYEASLTSLEETTVKAQKEFSDQVDNIGNVGREIVKLVDGAYDRVIQPNLQMSYDQRKAVNEYQEQIFEQMTDSFSRLTELVEQVSTSLFDLDKRAKQTALTFGYIGNKGQQYTNKIIQENLTAALWGKDAKDLLENQEKYLGTSDRGLMLSNREQDMTFAAARLFGMENSGEMATLFGEMNIFNTSIEKGADTMREMYDIANQMGVSNKKFVKDLSSNLKLAQKYNFVGGTKAMEKMSLWAQQVRLNLNSAAQFAEKLIGGGIEETLTTAANLQVLGGNAAIFSDPLGMMYDAGADMESMAHRIEAMVGNFGTLDRKTGETTFSWTDTKMMNEIAKALGMSREEVMNMNREKNKRSVVSRQMVGTDLTEEQKRMVSNRAYYDEESGEFKVNTFQNGPVAVKDLNKNLLQEILPEDNQEALVEYAKKSLSIEEQQLAVAKQTAALAMGKSATTWTNEMNERTELLQEQQGGMVNAAASRMAQVLQMETDSMKASFEKMNEALAPGGVFDTYITTFNNNLKDSVAKVSELNTEYDKFTKALVKGGATLAAFLGYIGAETGNESLQNTAENLIVSEAFKQEYGDKWFYKFVTGTPLMHLFIDEEDKKKTSNNLISGDNVEKIGDGVIHNPMVASIDNADRLYAAKSGGALDKSLEIIAAMVSHISNQIQNGIDTNTNLNVNGNLNVQGNNIDVTKLVKMISNDTDASYELLKLVNDTMSKQENLKVRTTRLI